MTSNFLRSLSSLTIFFSLPLSSIIPVFLYPLFLFALSISSFLLAFATSSNSSSSLTLLFLAFSSHPFLFTLPLCFCLHKLIITYVMIITNAVDLINPVALLKICRVRLQFFYSALGIYVKPKSRTKSLYKQDGKFTVNTRFVVLSQAYF